MARVFIQSLDNGYGEAVRNAFAYLGDSASLTASDTVCIKPNLTYPTFREGVMTNPEALEAVVIHLKNYTDRIVICESDSGGYNPFSMDEVFAATGISEIARRYGARIVNLSHEPSRDIRVRAGFRRLSVPLPRLVLDETDLFITMPVPKVHLNTVVSIAIKNQWGIIQKPSLRLKLHPYFREVIYQVNKALPAALAIVDGKFGLTRSGPMRGDATELNWLMASDDLFVTDYVVTDIMGLDVARVPYLRYILRKEGIDSFDSVAFNTDHLAFRGVRFHLQREWTDYPGVLTFNSRLLAYVGYESILAKPLHWMLYRFREPFY
jgi:uncharacterized protein (DUF362 family)